MIGVIPRECARSSLMAGAFTSREASSSFCRQPQHCGAPKRASNQPPPDILRIQHYYVRTLCGVLKKAVELAARSPRTCGWPRGFWVNPRHFVPITKEKGYDCSKKRIQSHVIYRKTATFRCVSEEEEEEFFNHYNKTSGRRRRRRRRRREFNRKVSQLAVA